MPIHQKSGKCATSKSKINGSETPTGPFKSIKKSSDNNTTLKL